MRIAISTDCIQAPVTGIGEYTLRLIEALLDSDDIADLYGYSQAGVGRLTAVPSVPDPIPHSRGSQPRHRIRQRVRRLSGLLSRHSPLNNMGELVYHEPNYLPRPFKGPTVVTVHDLSHVHYPACHPRSRVMALDWLLPRALSQADRVIAVSHHVARELQTHYGLSAARIHVVHHGVDEGFRALTAQQTVPTLTRYGLEPDGYILSLATLEPRKNLDRLMTAYEALPGEVRARWPLVLAGASGWRTEATRKRIERLVATGVVRQLGYVPAADRVALYAGARAFAYPALYEGFGLPPLEAMASGTPVLSSDRSAMPEVAGGAALAVNPFDVDAIAAGLKRLLMDDSLRRRLRHDGLARAAGFTWCRCASQTAEAYRQAAAA